MKILILGSVALPVPPLLQGGTERIAYFQAKGLAGRGHEVTLVAARGSRADPSYQLVEIGGGDTVAGSTNATKEIAESSRKLRSEMVYLTQVLQWMDQHAGAFDLVINNMRGGEALFHHEAKKLETSYVTVMHVPMFGALAHVCQELRTPLISISNAQRREFPDLNYIGTVYNGIDPAQFSFSPDPGDYLLMMGTIAPHKNQKGGIAVAKAVGTKLVIAGKIGDPSYDARDIAPHVDGSSVIYHGELGMEEKVALYKNAKALLFPILWEEPFGLVMIEAMASGTPVIAFRRGAVPEVVVDGKTGFIVQNDDEMIDAVKNIGSIDRAACRRHVEEHFTVEKMLDALEQALISL